MKTIPTYVIISLFGLVLLSTTRLGTMADNAGVSGNPVEIDIFGTRSFSEEESEMKDTESFDTTRFREDAFTEPALEFEEWMTDPISWTQRLNKNRSK
jgi:hypothetical protein